MMYPKTDVFWLDSRWPKALLLLFLGFPDIIHVDFLLRLYFQCGKFCAQVAQKKLAADIK